TVSMINKYDDGKIVSIDTLTDFDKDLEKTANDTIKDYREHMDKFEFPEALASVWAFISRANKYIDETKPWVLAKDDAKKAELQSVLGHLAESLRLIAVFISPVMTQSPHKIFAQLGLNFENDAAVEFGKTVIGRTVTDKPESIFLSLDAK